jgi:hypothetical protein
VNVVSPVASERVLQTLPYVLDEGFTWAGDPNDSSSPTRFGLAVTRDTDITGKFIDTNNSTNDFITNDPDNDPFEE